MKKLFLLLFLATLVNASFKYTNDLIKEESPYLLEHAHNPVNWTIWSDKAFKKAEKENKLLFVSIGYSTCHWCHVMQEESFENEAIAKALNKDYISIKIDKEQSPHLDSSYQDMLKKLKKRRNGWPLTFILNHKKELLYITTYIPPTFNYGVEGMNSLIPRIAKEYKEKNPALLKQISIYKTTLKQKEEELNSIKQSSNLENTYIKLMKKRYDKVYKGFDKQPKFPLASHLNLLLDIYSLNGNEEAYHMAIDSLEAMAKVGINDQIEGGFFRYSVYPDWLIPHFEKMLYTQAELISLYSKAYKITKNELFKNIVIQTIKSTDKRFKNRENLYYSAIDADSKNQDQIKQEGFYYTYSYDDVKNLLLKKDIKNYEEVLEYLGFDDFGNFEEGLNNTNLSNELKEPKNSDEAIALLKEIREKRNFPFIDKKIITSWNALMIKSLFEASKIDKKYLKQAEESLASLFLKLTNNSLVYHQKFDNKLPNKKGLLEDYVFLVDAFIHAYQSTFNKEYLDKAIALNSTILKKFYKNKKWYLTQNKTYEVVFNDRYYTAAISRHLHNMLSLANITSNLSNLEQSKNYIKELQNRFLTFSDSNPEAIRALIRVQKGDIILKSSQENLLDNKKHIEQIIYPFFLQSIQDTNLFLACDEKSCFSYNKDLNIVIQAIDK